MLAAAQLVEAGARWRAVSREKEDGSLLGQAMSDEANIIGLTNIGLGSERARADGTKTLGWIDIEAGCGGCSSGVAEGTKGTYRQASRQRQGANESTELHSGGGNFNKTIKVTPTHAVATSSLLRRRWPKLIFSAEVQVNI